MRRPDLEKFGEEHGLKLITIADLAEYKNLMKKVVVPRNKFPTNNNNTNNASSFQQAST